MRKSFVAALVIILCSLWLPRLAQAAPVTVVETTVPTAVTWSPASSGVAIGPQRPPAQSGDNDNDNSNDNDNNNGNDNGSGGWTIELPEFPTPQEMVTDILAFMAEAFIDAIRDWLNDLVQATLAWVQAQWALDNEGGLLGSMLKQIFDYSLLLGGPFIVVAISLTFFQQWLVRVFPGLVRPLMLGQIFGRVFIVALFVNTYARDFMIGFVQITNELAFSFLLGNGGTGGFIDWSWLSNFMAIALSNPNAIFYFGIGLILAGAAAIGMIAMLFIKQLLAVLIIGILPLMAVAWLFPFTEGLWGKYWWMFVKLSFFPFLLAFVLRVIMTILEMMGDNYLVGMILIMLIQFAGSWMMIKFLLMPETLLTAAGVALTAAGAGQIGLPMIGQAITRISGSSGAGTALRTAGRVSSAANRGSSDGG